ncbi:coordinator of PRMT5 and differentiation stimulator [Pteropus vampyrus]|uniref:Coordinator of PRMT5 and differentiation stimulator n=1 Tax=Pteropus vampyrus TaxID=132908 RepID=A0A6P6CGL0_PTEVA|nr:coordinator of PRMT5 and differentiation stimulator [Pteropus vampyrus]
MANFVLQQWRFLKRVVINTAGFAPNDHSGQEREIEKATDRLGESISSTEKDSLGQWKNTGFGARQNCFHFQHWTFFGYSFSPSLLPLICLLKLPADADDIQGCISQEVKPWVCCAPQGDMIYDPSWHHPPPLIPHYSKMVFETGQFDDAED